MFHLFFLPVKPYISTTSGSPFSNALPLNNLPCGVLKLALRIVFSIFFFVASALCQPREHLTVERIFQKPHLDGVRVSNIQWSPDGTKLAYLRADEMNDNKDLWWFDIGSKKSGLLVKAKDILQGEQKFSKEEEMVRERTRQTDVGITSYFWSPDGKALFIPLSGDVYRFNHETREIKNITESAGSEFDAKVSPSGTHIAYVRDGEVYSRNILTNIEMKLTSGSTDKIKNGISEYIAQEEMDRSTGYWWSPDGKHIAYLQIDNTPVKVFHLPKYLTPYTEVDQQEYAKAGEANTIVKVGVVGVDGGTTQWLDLGSNIDMYVARVNWLSDGERVAVQRQSRNQDTLDVLLCDIQTGQNKLLLRETDSRWVNLHDNLSFVDDGEKFIWSSERDGFQHLYLYDENGKLIRQITKGQWQVEKLLAVDEKNSQVYFTATEKSPVERQVYRIHLDGSGLKQISTGEGWHEASFSPDAKYFTDTYSTSTHPPSLSLFSKAGKSIASIESNASPELEKYSLPEPEFFTIKNSGGVDLNALMIKPSSFDTGKKYPVIVYVYGGPTVQIVANQWGAGGGMARSLWHRRMADSGYIVFMVDGRGTSGRGREFQNVIHKQLGSAELGDQLDGVKYLKSLPFVDPDRIMIWGKSYGGFLTCVAMFKTENVFKLGIALAPVTDWKNYDTHYTERYLERPQVSPEGYRMSSPLYFAGGLKNRFLLVHGVADDNVHYQDSMLLVEALQRANKQFDFMPYPKSTHSFGGDDVGTHLYNLLTRYIQEHL